MSGVEDFFGVVPWYPGEFWNFLTLILATVVVAAVPVVYATQINLRDPLARAILAGTSVTGVAFLVTVVGTLAYHAGWNPDIAVWNWVSRALYISVAMGKAAFLWALLTVVRENRRMRFPETSGDLR